MVLCQQCALALAGELTAVVHTGDMAYYAAMMKVGKAIGMLRISALTNASVPILGVPGNAEAALLPAT